MAAQGTFRVTNGFDCHLQTWDDALYRDRRADEVFLKAEVLDPEVAPGLDRRHALGCAVRDPEARRPGGDDRMVGGFVGRAEELRALAVSLDAVRSGTPHVVVVKGPAGSGKTALLQAFAAELDIVRVVWAAGDDAESVLPYGFLDQLAAQLPEASPSGAATSPGARPHAGQVEVRAPFVEGATLLQRLGLAQENAPVVLLLDDAHLSDRASLSAVTFALRRLRAERVLVVVTARPEEPAQLPAGLTNVVAATTTHVPLSGLSVAEIIALAHAVGFGRLSERGATRLREHTAGSPLHLRALMADLTMTQVEAVGTALPAPRSLALAVLAAVGQTTPQAQRLAAAAAVLGQRALLREVALLAEVADALAAVEELQRVWVLTLSDALYGRQVAFVHPLVRAAISDDIGAATAARLHARAAALTTGADAIRHRVAAAAGPDPELVQTLREHAEQAQKTGNWAQAATALLAAVRLSDPSPDRNHLLIDAVGLLLIDGNVAAASAYADQLAELPEEPDRLQAQARMALLSGRYDDAELLAHTAWELAGEARPQTRDDAAALLAQLCILRNDGAGAARWAEHAVAAGLLNDGMAASTRGAGALGLAMIGRGGDALRLLHELPADPRAVEVNRRQELRARGSIRMWTDDLAGARADLLANVPVPGEDLEPHRLSSVTALVTVEYRLGDWDTAASLAEHVVALVRDTEQGWLLAFAHAAAVLVAGGRGEWARAEEHLEAARNAAAVLGDQVSRAYTDDAAVHLALCRADPSGVVAASRWLLGERFGSSDQPGIFSWAVHHADALIELRHFDDAAARIAVLERTADQQQHRSRLAALARLRGQLAAAQRHPTLARAAFEDALRLGEEVAEALEAGRAHAAYGRFLRRRGERRAAIERLSSAREVFTALGAKPFLATCEAELAACGVHAATSVARGSFEQLTPQELAVARLVCAGLTNRQAADELVLSVKTVGYHLGNVYSKLSVRSRTELINRLTPRHR